MVFPGVALCSRWESPTTGSPRTRRTVKRACTKVAGFGRAERAEGHSWKPRRDHRVWALFLIYGACFGVELTMHNIAALYYHDRFGLGIAAAGLIAGLFGLMNIFARTLGGVFGDMAGIRFGLKRADDVLGRNSCFCWKVIALAVFSQMAVLPVAIMTMLVFSLFVQMSEGATFSVVPFMSRRALGAVAGIVGAGGNAGAVAAGFLFRMESLVHGAGAAHTLGRLSRGLSTLVLRRAVLAASARPRSAIAMERALGRGYAIAIAPAYAKRVPDGAVQRVVAFGSSSEGTRGI